VPADPSGKTEPIHGAGHLYVAEHRIDRDFRGEYSDRFLGIGRFDNQIAGSAEILGQRIADDNVVFSDQDCRLTRRRF
jgi:hypothetical protein